MLEAWKQLQDYDMELYIGGPIDKNVQNLIDAQYSDLKNVFNEVDRIFSIHTYGPVVVVSEDA